jgi:methionyl-tRNA formyltransferase
MKATTSTSESHHEKTRVVVFGSFHRGYHILKNLLNDPQLMQHVEIVGVVTDDPAKNYTNAKNRVWQYSQNEDDKYMVEKLADAHGIPVYKGRVKPPDPPLKDPAKQEKAAGEAEAFRTMLKEEWKPDIIYMGTFGQRIDKEIFSIPPMGMYNMHPSDEEEWPSCTGPNPFEQLFEKHRADSSKGKNAIIVLHEVDELFDNGQKAACSERIAVPYEQMKHMSEGDKVLLMHKITSPHAGMLANSHLRSQIDIPLLRSHTYQRHQACIKRGSIKPEDIVNRDPDNDRVPNL